MIVSFFFSCYRDHRDLHSFPTRRSSDLVEEFADILQIGTRNMANFALLKRVGKSHRPVMLKRGMASTVDEWLQDRKSTRLNSSHVEISYAVFCLKKKTASKTAPPLSTLI